VLQGVSIDIQGLVNNGSLARDGSGEGRCPATGSNEGGPQ
jgi:hypothetical protein